jgi:hypothetical protein
LSRGDAITTLTSNIGLVFTHVRLYHACRPVDVADYDDDGIRRHDGRVLDRARAVFRDQGIPAGVIDAAIADTDLEIDQGRVFLALDDEHMVHYTGHYLIYGSEGVMSIAATLIGMGYPNAQRALARIGRPAMFTCDVPIRLLSATSRREIAEMLYYAYRQRRGRAPRSVGPSDHTAC